MIIGYLLVSVCESFFHRTIQHATEKLRSVYEKFGQLGSAFICAWYSHHVVHHHLTFRMDHVTQFSSHDEQSKLDRFLHSKGKQHVIAEEYGSRIGVRPKDYLLYVGPTLPIFSIVCWVGGTKFTIGALMPLCIWPMLAQFIHPYLHMEYSQISAEAPLIIRAFSSTRFFRFLSIHHWLHHRYENCNFNLLLGGDIILGTHRLPTAGDLAEMQAIGIRTPKGVVKETGVDAGENGP